MKKYITTNQNIHEKKTHHNIYHNIHQNIHMHIHMHMNTTSRSIDVLVGHGNPMKKKPVHVDISTHQEGVGGECPQPLQRALGQVGPHWAKQRQHDSDSHTVTTTETPERETGAHPSSLQSEKHPQEAEEGEVLCVCGCCCCYCAARERKHGEDNPHCVCAHPQDPFLVPTTGQHTQRERERKGGRAAASIMEQHHRERQYM